MERHRAPESPKKDLAAKTEQYRFGCTSRSRCHMLLHCCFLKGRFQDYRKGLLNKARKETIVIDVGNYYPFRDGPLDELEMASGKCVG